MADSFMGVRVAGGLLPAELLSRIAAGALAGQTSADYHLAPGETIREAANRAWAYLTGVWATYRQAAEKLPEGDRGTTLTRERWLLILLRELGYGRVPTTPTGGLSAGTKAVPISHVWEHVPIHLLGHRVDLDRRSARVAGAATSSPQSMVQELLNRSDTYQWAILGNGLTLRLLRDSTSLVGSAYVEFDLEAIFDGDLFADFLLMFSVCHQSRVEVRDPEKGAASCWLEAWRTESLESGTRALNQLRDGVISAITTLGTGFLAHPANVHLREGLRDGSLRIDDVNHALLRVAYRLLFTFVAEDRGLLLPPEADPQARQRYETYFSTERLRRTARRRRGTRHTDQWRALSLLWDGLGSVDGRLELGLVGIGGLFEPGPLDVFADCDLSNEALLRAVRHLSLVTEPGSGIRRTVDYRNLGAEELGSIYEALLEFMPSWNAEKRSYELLSSAGNDRKSTGSYYTPSSLIDCLLDSALDPVLDRAEREPDPEAALLAVTVCDPACGSGHFLVAAARRIAKRVAAIRTGDPEPPPERVREALGDVVTRCIYGVDINPLAAELAKVSLWLETMEPGRPLAFLDAQIKVGNSLIGATPVLIGDGVPDEAFAPIEGDDRKITNALKRLNKSQRAGKDDLFGDSGASLDAQVARSLGRLLDAPRAGTLADIHARQRQLREWESSPELEQQRLVADAWCAAFVWPKHVGGPSAVTDQTLRALERGEPLAVGTAETVRRLAEEYRFFHWHLELPHIFATGDAEGSDGAGGFDVVLANPPWERVKLQEQEFFAVRDPSIAAAPTAAVRKRLIQKLEASNPALFEQYLAALRQAAGESHLLRNSGRYPLTGRGDINTYAVFAETSRNLIDAHGRMGLILPTGIATDATTQFFFGELIKHRRLRSLYDFENVKQLFQGVASRTRFCLLTATGTGETVQEPMYAFFAHHPSDLESTDRRIVITARDIEVLNPNTKTCPSFRSATDARITIEIYRRVPVLIDERSQGRGNPWGVEFLRMFDMTNDSHLFHAAEELEAQGWSSKGIVYHPPRQPNMVEAFEADRSEARKMVPLIEAKMTSMYDHRAADIVQSATAVKRKNQPAYLSDADHGDTGRLARPASWVDHNLVPPMRARCRLGFPGVSSPTNARTFTATLFPDYAFANSVALIEGPDEVDLCLLAAQMNSFVMDYVVRQKVAGLNLNFFLVAQFPFLTPASFEGPCPWDKSIPLDEWFVSRVGMLSLTAVDMQPLADALGLPIRAWDAAERHQLKCEIDAGMFHLFGVDRTDMIHIMDSFETVRMRDVRKFGTFLTKEDILKVFDSMQEAASVDDVENS